MLVPLTTDKTTLEEAIENDLTAFPDRKTCISCGITVRTIHEPSNPATPHLTGHSYGLPDMGQHITCVRRWSITHYTFIMYTYRPLRST